MKLVKQSSSSEELNSDFAGLKTEKKKELRKKIIIAGISCGLLLLIILIIILAVSRNNSKNEDEEDEIYEKDILGQIDCVYNIISPSKPINILGNEFENNF